MKKKPIWEVTIRPCRLTDLAGISEISNLTWDGDDYLGKIAREWIQEGHFYLAEFNGKVVGTNKMSLFPGKVAWLEGLRVHPEYQKHGIGKQLSDFIMQEALKLQKDEVINKIEFCTFYKNIESIRMAEKIGFRVVYEMYILRRAVSKRMIQPDKTDIPDLLLNDLGDYLPWGWKSVHNIPEGRKWLRAHGQGYRTGDTYFYVGGLEPITVIPNITEEKLVEIIPCLNYLFKEKKEIEILVPGSQPEMIPVLKRHRFNFWCKPEEPNMLIYSLFQSKGEQ